jgi:invasion protein IalB
MRRCTIFAGVAARRAVIRNGVVMITGLGKTFARAALLAVAAGLVLSAQVPSSRAQQNGSVRATHGSWSIICDTPAGASSEQCIMMQNVVAEDRADLGLSVVILKTADRKAEIMRVLAPLGVLLPTGLGLYIDKKDNGRAYFKQCFSDGCYAEVILEQQLIDTLRNGKEATFIVFATPEEGIGIPVDLAGFGEAFDALP